MVLREVKKRDKAKKKHKEKVGNQRQQEKQEEEENQRQQEKQKEDKVVNMEDPAESLMAKQVVSPTIYII